MKKKSPAQTVIGAIEKYIKVIKLPTNNGDAWDGFQIKQVLVQGEKVIETKLIEKPDTKQMTLAKAELMLNPDEEYNHA